MALRETREGGWTYDLFQDAFADPATVRSGFPRLVVACGR